MAPEVSNSSNYGFEVDVFSFAIVMFEILFETVEPYGQIHEFGIHYKVSQDPNFRPNIKNFENVFKEKNSSIKVFEELIELMKKCWDHDPTKRPDFKEIVKTLNKIWEILTESDENDVNSTKDD